MHAFTRLFLLLAPFLAGCFPQPQSKYSKDFWLAYYQKSLTPGNRPVGAGPNWTLEQGRDGRFVRKEYYYDTRQKTSELTYADSRLATLDGPALTWSDAGVKTEEGTHKAGQRDGIWRRYDWKTGTPTSVGAYRAGKQEGEWTYFDKDGVKNYACTYRDGELEGNAFCYRPDGSVTRTEVWRAGKKISEEPPIEGIAADTTADVQIAPSFPCDPKHADGIATLTAKNCGERSLMAYLSRNIKYPKSARDIELQGRAIITFVIGKDGSVEDVEALRGLSRDIEAECIRVVSQMPKWEPGSHNGQPVRVKYTLPISLRLE